MTLSRAKRILIAPLDWGLGHTTRCIPIIRHLITLGHTVVFAGEQWQISFVASLFPNLELKELPGYRVRYSAAELMPALMRQIPGIVRSIKREHDWLLTLTEQEEIDGVISDNRYGLWHPHVPSVILTHQPLIISGLGQWIDGILCRYHARYLHRFRNCWIVDHADEPNLGGVLSHPPILPRNAQYIGWLSQLSGSGRSPAHDNIMVLLSGPEPQRTMLSDILWKAVQDIGLQVVFIEGSEAADRQEIPSHIQYHRRVNAQALQQILESSSLVICRSGYSSIMDLVRMGKRAILIPTPGQTEQEYLAKTLHARGHFYAVPQKDLSLSVILDAINSFPFYQLSVPNGYSAFEEVLERWLTQN